MNMKNLFELMDSLVGDISEYLGLTFRLNHGIVIVDHVQEYEFNGDVVSGFIIDFIPYDGEQVTYFAPDEEGLKYIISEFVLE